MRDQQPDAVIDQLKRKVRFWKFLSLGTFAILVFAVAGLTTLGVLQAVRQRAAADAARIEAEQARQKAEAPERDLKANQEQARQAATEVRRKAEQILYASNIQQVQKAWDAVPSVAAFSPDGKRIFTGSWDDLRPQK